ncbi:MAG: efflux RND transporter permease subunit [Bdellovibrionota bacterium]
MNLSGISIRRPVLATVLSLLIVVAGAGSLGRLPVREYPDVDNPVVSVRTVYAGASPETVETAITEPLEQALNGIEGIRTISSVSASGSSSIDVEFVTSRDVDAAASDVTNAIQAALGRLPEDAEQPVVSKTGANQQAIMWLSLRSSTKSLEELSDLAERVGQPMLQILPGVARIIIGGQRRYAMRVWLDPRRMEALGVDAADVRRTLVEGNVELPAGLVEGDTRRFTVRANAMLDDPAAFGRLIVREEGGRIVRLEDVAKIEMGSSNYNSITKYGGVPVIGLGIVKQSRANELEVAEAVEQTIPRLREALPSDVELEKVVDNTTFVRASLAEVWSTLFEAFILVVLVNWFFLRSTATTLIPSAAIPVSVVGTFAVLYALDFSVNTLTLLALVLAIGMLVDDAIVVLENVFRHVEEGTPPLEAAYTGSKEVGFAVLVTTISLVAIFIPLSLLTGTSGRLFREFSLTMAGSILISMFVALTFIPMLCARYLKPPKKSHGKVYLAIERFFAWLDEKYAKGLSWAVVNPKKIVGFLLGNVVASVLLFYFLPKTLTPVEDRGRILTFVKAPQGATLAYTDRTLKEIEAEMAKVDEVQGYFSAIGLAIGGPSSTSSGIVFARLKPWEERKTSQQELVASFFPKFIRLPGALAFPINPPALGGGSREVEFVIKSSSASTDELSAVAEELAARARMVPGLVNVDTNLLVSNPQLDVRIDRSRAADLGISVADIGQTLQILLAEQETGDFVLKSKQYDVIPSVAPEFRSTPEQIGTFPIRTREGRLVPLASVLEVKSSIAASELRRYALERAATVSASLAPGFQLGDALAAVEGIAKEILPPGYTTALSGASREFAESSAAAVQLFLFSLLFIYLVLAGQFESWLDPFVIILSVPLGLLGALLTLYFAGQSINLYSQVGIILLLGLVTKNAILLVEYANQLRERGLVLLDAVIEAGKTRLRPILMTSTTTILGAIPLIIASGAGAESRRAIGYSVVGGLTFATALTLLVIPVVYLLVNRFAERMGIATVSRAIEPVPVIPAPVPLPSREESHERRAAGK